MANGSDNNFFMVQRIVKILRVVISSWQLRIMKIKSVKPKP